MLGTQQKVLVVCVFLTLLDEGVVTLRAKVSCNQESTVCVKLSV